MSVYDITIRVPDEEGLSRLIASLRELDTVQSVAVATKVSPKKQMAYANNKRNKGVFGKDLLIELFRKKPTWKTAEIVAAFVRAGFSPNSASPRIAFLKKEGGIKQTDVNTYQRVRA